MNVVVIGKPSDDVDPLDACDGVALDLVAGLSVASVPTVPLVPDRWSLCVGGDGFDDWDNAAVVRSFHLWSGFDSDFCSGGLCPILSEGEGTVAL